MPPREGSRYTFSTRQADVRNIDPRKRKTTLSLPPPLRFVEHPQNRLHTVRLGDTLYALAERYYGDLSLGGGRRKGVPRAAGLWWAIAGFQTPPLADPTIALEPGSELIIPALDLIELHLARRPA